MGRGFANCRLRSGGQLRSVDRSMACSVGKKKDGCRPIYIYIYMCTFFYKSIFKSISKGKQGRREEQRGEGGKTYTSRYVHKSRGS